MCDKQKVRKNTSVELHLKLKALNDLKNGTPKSVIADSLGVHEGTIKSWIKHEDEIREWQNDYNTLQPNNRKRLRKPVNEMLDTALFIWFKEQRRSGSELSGPLMQLQALIFSRTLGGAKAFQASHGWLSKWKCRHGVRSITACGENSPADNEARLKYQSNFLEIIGRDELTPDQIFNCDEAGLNYGLMPKTIENAKVHGTPPGGKSFKERITIMACCNSSGTFKLPLLVVGKFAKPRAIKNLTHYPVCYKSHKVGWMTTELFEQWFVEEFVPQVKKFLSMKGLPQRAILFTDKCGTHQKTLSSDGIQVQFVPSNVASLMQPMDQGCFQNLKEFYRRKVVRFFSNHQGSVCDALKNLTIREVIYWIAEAWEYIPASTIIESWKSLWPQIGDKFPLNSENTENSPNNNAKQENTENRDNYMQENYLELAERFHQLLTKEEDYKAINVTAVQQWLHPDRVLQENELLSDNEIIEIVTSEEEKERIEPESVKVTHVSKKRSLGDIQDDLANVIAHCRDNSYYSKEQLLGLIELQKAMRVESLITEAKRQIKQA